MSQACTLQSLQVDEPLAGTAPVVSCYVIIEQPGPWGREALLDSHFPRELGEQLLALTKGTAVKIVLARHPDRLERNNAAGHNIWIAHTAPEHREMRHGLIEDLTILLTWDFEALAQGIFPPIGQIQTRPLTFVCTHGSRDACCAVVGRPIYDELLSSVSHDERTLVWEMSHLGGHRFAPTVLTLPSGSVHGRLSAAETIEMRAANADEMVYLNGFRGHGWFPAPLQVAGIAVRNVYDIKEAGAIDVLRVVNDRAVPALTNVLLLDDRVETEVRHTDGRTWRVHVQRVQLPDQRAESCGKAAESVHVWTVQEMQQTAD